VIVDAGGPLLDYWTDMCRGTGGRMSSVKLQ